MALTSSFSSAVAMDDTETTPVGGTSGKTRTINKNIQTQLADGSGAGQADAVLQRTIALNAGNSYEATLNLFDGLLKDEFGNTFEIDECKGVFFNVTTTAALANCEVFADQAVPADEFKGPLNNVVGDGITIEAANALSVSNGQAGGWTVDATNKQLVFVNNNATDTNIDVVISGVLK